MEAFQVYRSFNADKPIEELQYIMEAYQIELRNLKSELQFYKFLVEAAIFKPHVINLFEMLEQFKSKLKKMEVNRMGLLNKIGAHSNQIANKIECEDVACDAFFIKKHDTLEHEVHNFNQQVSNFKLNMYQYIQGVVKNE
ncbi:hypothetical protein [Snuella sedimenti]|uniref:Uncharacterized protein n=1 Tax=Snuella sedimenti TaxID=2798802 RepID=A0A8J7IMT7_9FLAO|nr:hypothetical protein [Snuella sedimenti]MBJ6367497.1 hypothetical protein [Snuella sedimenti]